jgi:glycosyltransferase involved in cell wall biosynthesis
MSYIGFAETRGTLILGDIIHGPLGLWCPITSISPTRELRVLFFGRINKYKGLSIFVAAIKLLVQEGYAVRGIIAGRGDELRNILSDLNEIEQFEVINKYLTPKEVVETFDSSHVVVTPYLEGTQSGVLAYALGRARACITTDVGSLGEMVRDRESSFIIAPDDHIVLADRLKLMTYDREMVERMSISAFDFSCDRVSWEKSATILTSLYENLVFSNKPLNGSN